MALADEFEGQENEKLKSEYDDAFDGEEKLQHKLVSIKSEVTLKEEDIDIDSIVISEFKKSSRGKTISGLSNLIADWGVVSPIHVLKLEDDEMYLLMDGLRRVYAALKRGEKKIRAIIWEFSDVDEGKDMAQIIALMINRTQQYSNKEKWNIMKDLLADSVSPGLIEFLIQLPSGDAMRLQDIMTADVDGFQEFRDKFLEDMIDLDAAYKKLQKCRKDIDKIAQDDATVITAGEDGGKDVVQTENRRLLEDDEVLDLLDMADKTTDEDIENTPAEDLDMTGEVNTPEVQDKDNRHPTDPMIKQATFRRDNFTCRCCGLTGEANIPVLVFHHVVGVACGGPDTVENGLTLCQNCHMLLHLYVFGKVRIEWDKFDEEEKKKFKLICKYGNIQIKAWKKVGVTKDEAYKKDAKSRRHLYPGEGLDEINSAYSAAKREGDFESTDSAESATMSAADEDTEFHEVTVEEGNTHAHQNLKADES